MKSFIDLNATNGQVKTVTHSETPKCPIILNSLHKALSHSYNNLVPSQKRYLIAVAPTSKMNEKCLHNPNITCYEAAAMIIMTLIKSEKHVILCCFTNQNVVQIPLDKGNCFLFLMICIINFITFYFPYFVLTFWFCFFLHALCSDNSWCLPT